MLRCNEKHKIIMKTKDLECPADSPSATERLFKLSIISEKTGEQRDVKNLNGILAPKSIPLPAPIRTDSIRGGQ